MTVKKAHDLVSGDVFRLHVYGQVIAVSSVAGGKRIKVKIEIENQGQRANCGAFGRGPDATGAPLEFTDSGHVLEFLCRPGRTFHVQDYWDDGDEDALMPITPLETVT